MWSQNYCISRDPPAATPKGGGRAHACCRWLQCPLGVGIGRCSVSSQDAALLQFLLPASPRSSVSGPPQPAESFAPPPPVISCVR